MRIVFQMLREPRKYIIGTNEERRWLIIATCINTIFARAPRILRAANAEGNRVLDVTIPVSKPALYATALVVVAPERYIWYRLRL